MKEHIIKKLSENPIKTLDALKMLDINIFEMMDFDYEYMNSESSLFESMMINLDVVFFEQNSMTIFNELKRNELDIILNVIWKFKYSSKYNDKSNAILSSLYNNPNYSAILLGNKEITLYAALILDNKSIKTYTLYNINDDVIENFMFNFLISFENDVVNNKYKTEEITQIIQDFLNHITEKTLYFKNRTIDNIVNKLYYKNKKQVLNTLLKIMLKNDLSFKDVLLRETKNYIEEEFFYLNDLTSSIDRINEMLQSQETLVIDIISRDEPSFNEKKSIMNNINNLNEFSALLKYEIENLTLKKIMNQKIEPLYVHNNILALLKENLMLVILINEKNSFKKITNKEDYELVKKRI